MFLLNKSYHLFIDEVKRQISTDGHLSDKFKNIYGILQQFYPNLLKSSGIDSSKVNEAKAKTKIDTSTAKTKIDTSNAKTKIDTSTSKTKIDTASIKTKIDTASIKTKKSAVPEASRRKSPRNISQKNLKEPDLRKKVTATNMVGGLPPYYPSSYQYQQYPPSHYNRSSYYPPSPYNQRPYLASNMIKNDLQNDVSKLAFDITIALELYPGENIPKEQLAALKCNSRWEDVRKAWSEFIGKPYVIIPSYPNSQNNPKSNQTQRYNPYQRKRGGKKNTTRKNK
jgi:hypothetical protein